MTARIPLPDGWADRPFRIGDAVRAGMSTSRLDGGDLDRPFWGIRTPATGRAKVYYNVFDESGLVARTTLPLRARGAPY